MTALGQTAKNSRKALTSELPPITDVVRPRGAPFALPSAAKPFRAASGQIAFGFLEIIADGRAAIAHRRPETLRRNGNIPQASTALRWTASGAVDRRGCVPRPPASDHPVAAVLQRDFWVVVMHPCTCDGSRSPRPSRWALRDWGDVGRQGPSQFLGGKSQMGRPRFFSRGPETLPDGRWSHGRRARGWSRLPSRSRTADPETLPDGVGGPRRGGRGSHPRRSTAADAGQRDTILPSWDRCAAAVIHRAGRDRAPRSRRRCRMVDGRIVNVSLAGRRSIVDVVSD